VAVGGVELPDNVVELRLWQLAYQAALAATSCVVPLSLAEFLR
jgi:hypothetical protein